MHEKYDLLSKTNSCDLSNIYNAPKILSFVYSTVLIAGAYTEGGARDGESKGEVANCPSYVQNYCKYFNNF